MLEFHLGSNLGLVIYYFVTLGMLLNVKCTHIRIYIFTFIYILT